MRTCLKYFEIPTRIKVTYSDRLLKFDSTPESAYDHKEWQLNVGQSAAVSTSWDSGNL